MIFRCPQPFGAQGKRERAPAPCRTVVVAAPKHVMWLHTCRIRSSRNARLRCRQAHDNHGARRRGDAG